MASKKQRDQQSITACAIVHIVHTARLWSKLYMFKDGRIDSSKSKPISLNSRNRHRK